MVMTKNIKLWETKHDYITPRHTLKHLTEAYYTNERTIGYIFRQLSEDYLDIRNDYDASVLSTVAIHDRGVVASLAL